MTIYSKEELLEFHKQKVKELEDKLKENEERFSHTLPSNNENTRIPWDDGKRMIADFQNAQKRIKSGKKHTEYTREF